MVLKLETGGENLHISSFLVSVQNSKQTSSNHYSSGLFITLVWPFSLFACPHLSIFVFTLPPPLKVEMVAKQPAQYNSAALHLGSMRPCGFRQSNPQVCVCVCVQHETMNSFSLIKPESIWAFRVASGGRNSSRTKKRGAATLKRI